MKDGANSWVGVTTGPAAQLHTGAASMIKEANLKLCHHTRLSWEGKWGRQGCFSYSWVLFLKESAGVLNSRLRPQGGGGGVLGEDEGAAGPGIG